MSFAEGTPTVEIQLGGKPYTLGWTWGAKRRVRESLIGRHADPKNAGEEENLATVLWASMEEEHRKALTVENIEDMIHADNEVEISKKIEELCLRSEPEPDPNAQPAAVKKPTAGTERSASTSSARLESTISA